MHTIKLNHSVIAMPYSTSSVSFASTNMYLIQCRSPTTQQLHLTSFWTSSRFSVNRCCTNTSSQ